MMNALITLLLVVARTARTRAIPTCNLARLEAKIETLNRKAARYGTGPIALTVHAHEDAPRDDVWYSWVEVEGAAPCIAGWEFVATLAHEEGGTMLRTVPTAELADGELRRFYDATPDHCDHCNTRRRRNDTYVVRNTSTGELKQVGKSCLRDFLGGLSPARALAMAAYLRDAEDALSEDYSGGTPSEYVARIHEFLTFTAAAVRRFGYLSKSAAADDETSTASLVWSMLFPFSQAQRDASDKFRRNLTEADSARAAEVLARARAHFAGDNLSEFEHNLRVIVAGETIRLRQAGYAAFLVSWLEREEGKAAEASRRAEAAQASRHFGTVKKRETFRLTVRKIVDWESMYGFTHLHLMADESGNVAVWKSSSARLETGVTYDVKGTVKEHSDYNGTAQTVLTRCKAERV